MRHQLLLMILAGSITVAVGCDRDESKPPSSPDTQRERPTLVEKSTDSPEAPDPEPQAPSEADYEDAPGTVKRIANTWVIVTEEDEARQLCLPAETPADVLEEGTKVRFTLYLAASRPDVRSACEPVKTLVSIRPTG